MTHETPISVVAIDDDPLQLRLIEKRLAVPHPGLNIQRVLSFTEASEAQANLPAQGAVAILCDYDMPGGTGLDWLRDLTRPGVGPVLILTATGDERIAARAFREGAADYLIKSEVMGEDGKLQLAIADAMRRHTLSVRNRERSQELKIANRDLLEKNRRLNEMTETAHQFVDNVAHDFRSPLTVIREFASILTDEIGGTLTSEQREFVEYIEQSARNLNTMVDDFLDSSKLKNQTLRVCRRAATAQSVLESVRPLLQARAEEKSITLCEQIEPGLPDVFVDTQKIGRVLVNLVVNAVKFSPEGSEITINIHTDGNGGVEFEVRDRGVGIAPGDLPKIYERFTQFGDPRRSVAKGFGLGLSIARDLVWLNLGTMRISSEEGLGSTFAFTVPVNDPATILRHYINRIERTEEDEPLTLLEVHAFNPATTQEQMREDLSAVTRSMDLLLPGNDGKTLYAVGPSDQPDGWITKLTDGAERAGKQREKPNPLNIAWQGTWALDKAEDNILSTINRNNLEERACA